MVPSILYPALHSETNLFIGLHINAQSRFRTSCNCKIIRYHFACPIRLHYIHIPKHVCNFLSVLRMQYIYRQKCQKQNLNFQELKYIYCTTEKIELYIATKNNTLCLHNKKLCDSVTHGPHLPVNQDYSLENYVHDYLTNP